MSRVKGISAFFVFLFLIGAIVVSHRLAYAEVCDRIVAMVEDDLVTLYELNKRIRQLTGMDPRELERKDRQKFLRTRQQVLDYLIDEKITQKKIKELGIEVTDKEVDEAIEKIKRDNHLTQEDLIGALKAQGMTYLEYRKKVKTDLERMQLINYEVKSKIIIKDKQVKNYYKEHQDQFKVKGSLRLAMIFLPSDSTASKMHIEKTVQTIYDKLYSGEDFATLAKQYSKGPGASAGGDIGEFDPNQLDPKIKKAIQDLEEGQVTQPIYRPNGVQIIKVVKRYKGSVRPFEEVREAIYDILYRQEVNKRYYAWIKDLRNKAYIKICF